LTGDNIGCDLHFHSRHSDGRYFAAQLPRKLAAHGVRIAALADHDTMNGYPAFFQAAQALGITALPCLELTTYMEAGGERAEVHVLAPGVRVNEKLAKSLRYIREQRNELHRKMCARVNELGYDFDFNRLVKLAGDDPVMTSHYLWDLFRRKPLWVLSIVAAGKFKKWYDGFISATVAPGAKAYIPPPLKFTDGIAWVREHEGLAVIAHPAKIASEKVRVAAMQADCDGYEVYYRNQDGIRDELLRIVDERGLVATGGSDWHGYIDGPYKGWEMPRARVRALLDRLGLTKVDI
jgi:predicted metal-dependent phosphoesterase TrpH